MGHDPDRLRGGLRARESPLGVVERGGRLTEGRVRANGCRVRGAERRRREPRAEPLDRRRCVRAPGGQPRGVLPERGQVDPDSPFRAATSGERGIRLVDGVQRGLAEVDDARAPRPALGRRVGDGVVEPLLQEERLVQPYPGGLERVAHVACGRRAELGVGERHLAFRLAHGRVGLHDQALGADLEGAAVVERDTLAPRAEAPEADDAARDRHGCGTEDEEGWQPPETFGHEPESRTCRCVVAGRRLGARTRPDRHAGGRESAVFGGMPHPRVLLSAHASAAQTDARLHAGCRMAGAAEPRGAARGRRPVARLLVPRGRRPTHDVARGRASGARAGVPPLPRGRRARRRQLPRRPADGRAHAARRRRRAHRPARGVRSVGPPHGGVRAARRADALPRPVAGPRRRDRPPGWYPTWAFWQWRGMRLRQLAPGWAYDPPGTADADAADAVRAAATPVGVVA